MDTSSTGNDPARGNSPMATPPATGRSRMQSLVAGDAIQRILALGALVVLLLFFSAISEPFRTTENFTSILVATGNWARPLP